MSDIKFGKIPFSPSLIAIPLPPAGQELLDNDFVILLDNDGTILID